MLSRSQEEVFGGALVPSTVAVLPQSLKRQAQGSVSKATKPNSSAFSPMISSQFHGLGRGHNINKQIHEEIKID